MEHTSFPCHSVAGKAESASAHPFVIEGKVFVHVRVAVMAEGVSHFLHGRIVPEHHGGETLSGDMEA
jgi:hypothetical protein